VAFVQPANPRAAVAESHEGLEIVVPRPRHVGNAIGTALCFAVVAYVTSGSIFEGATPAARALVTVLFCIVSALVVLHRLLRGLFGLERIVVSPSTLRIRSEILGVGLRREYRIASVRRLRAVRQGADDASGALAFDHGSDDVRFAEGLAEDEARSVVDRMRARAPFPP
jgi:hypothetical protein